MHPEQEWVGFQGKQKGEDKLRPSIQLSASCDRTCNVTSCLPLCPHTF